MSAPSTSPSANRLGRLTGALYRQLAGEYRELWQADLCAVDAAGRLVFGHSPYGEQESDECREAMLEAITGTLRWGEATVSFCPGDRLIWAVPLTINEELVGGLVASLPETHAFSPDDAEELPDFREMCESLRLLAEREKLTNASLLELRRLQYAGEQSKAYAIHAFKTNDHNSLRQLYLREEPNLFAAIRAGDRPSAREIINRILVALHHHAGERTDLLKSVFLELVVTMSRTAVEAGGSPEELLGTNFNSMVALSSLNTEGEIGVWLVRTLEHLLDAIERAKTHDPGALVSTAVAHMKQNCAKNIHRDDVAVAAGVSPSHLSFLIRKETGSTFTELLNEMRVSRAADLLRQTDLSLSTVAMKCGFVDQSYFTKVFKRYRKQTPLKYRRQS